MTRKEFLHQAKKCFGECHKVMENRNKKRGDNGNAFEGLALEAGYTRQPLRCLLLRYIGLKLARLWHNDTGRKEANDNNLIDLINYAVILMVVEKDTNLKGY